MTQQTQTIARPKDGQEQQVQQPPRGQPGQLARWDPFALFDEFEEQMARLWGRTLGLRPMAHPLRRLAQFAAPTTWAPRIDVFEKQGNLVVKAELPGIKKDDVQVELEDGDLVIRGESRAESEVKDDDFYRMERSFGSFYRRLPLPFEARPEQIQASMADGVLEVRISKPAERKSEAKRITIK